VLEARRDGEGEHASEGDSKARDCVL